MASIKTILKKTKTQAIVKIVGDGNVTISPSDIVHSSQTVDSPNVFFPISAIIYNLKGDTNFIRNGNSVLQLNGATYGSFDLAQGYGAQIREDANSNVLVTLAVGYNTVILTFSKEAGFIETDRQTLQPKDR